MRASPFHSQGSKGEHMTRYLTSSPRGRTFQRETSSPGIHESLKLWLLFIFLVANSVFSPLPAVLDDTLLYLCTIMSNAVLDSAGH